MSESAFVKNICETTNYADDQPVWSEVQMVGLVFFCFILAAGGSVAHDLTTYDRRLKKHNEDKTENSFS